MRNNTDEVRNNEEAIQKMTPLTEFTGRKMLNALESIEGTLKSIEQFLKMSFTRTTSR